MRIKLRPEGRAGASHVKKAGKNIPGKGKSPQAKKRGKGEYLGNKKAWGARLESTRVRLVLLNPISPI